MGPSSMRHSAFVAFKSVVVLAGMALAMQQVAAAQPSIGPVPVNIVGPLPVPVSGPVTVSGTLAVRDVDLPARSPFQASLCTGASFAGGVAPSCGNLNLSLQVPSNRRLVIEYISGDCSRSGDVTLIQISLGTSTGGTGASHRVRFGLNPLDPRFLEAAQPVRLYADPGTFVGMGASFSSGPSAGSVGCTITLSGHTVAL